MAKQCAVTGKSSKVAGRYSNRVRATQFNPTGKVRRKANLQKKRIYIPELKKYMTLTLSTKSNQDNQQKTAHIKLSKKLD